MNGLMTVVNEKELFLTKKKMTKFLQKKRICIVSVVKTEYSKTNALSGFTKEKRCDQETETGRNGEKVEAN